MSYSHAERTFGLRNSRSVERSIESRTPFAFFRRQLAMKPLAPPSSPPVPRVVLLRRMRSRRNNDKGVYT